MPTSNYNVHFKGYELINTLGKGNAQVRKARHIDSGDLVAIKHYSIDVDSETMRRFQQESEIMTNISHPHIVGVREICLEAHFPYIVMDYVEGGDLRKLLLERRILPSEIIILLGKQIADALNCIHKNGIIHRDIKPENIVYRILPDGSYHFLLTDFGIAKIREQSKTQTGQSLMTFDYASPEQFDDPKAVTFASDFYSLGVVLYECMTGNVPFSHEKLGFLKFTQQMSNIQPASILGNFPQKLKTTVLQLLEKTPEKREKAINELINIFSEVNTNSQNHFSSNESKVSGKIITEPLIERKVSTESINILKAYKWVWLFFGVIISIFFFLVYKEYSSQSIFSSNEPSVKSFADNSNLSLGNKYYKTKNYSKAFQYYFLSAKDGNAEGQNKLGLMYKNGFGVEKDYKEAVYWLKKSVEKQNSNGQVNLGLMYKNGLGVPKNNQKAIQLFEKASEQDNSDGTNNLGLMYLRGLGVNANYDEAFRLFKEAADQDNKYAQNNLGELYEKGMGVEKDIHEAERLYILSAKKGCELATKNLQRLGYK